MDAIPGVPPPPAEVKIRTMRSDLETMTKSGGGLPQFQNVTVSGLAVGHEAPNLSVGAPVQPSAFPGSQQVEQASSDGTAGGSHKMIGIILVIVVAVIALAVVGYFAYAYLGH